MPTHLGCDRRKRELEHPKEKPRDWKAVMADPKIRAAMREIDPSLLDWTLSLSPLERLRCASNAARALKRFKRVKTETG